MTDLWSAPWRIVAASVRGASHEHTGQPCQDAHVWRILPTGVLVAAVADGAGSAALAEVGAVTAAQAAVAAICAQASVLPTLQSDDDWRLFLTDALRAAREAVEREAATRQASPRDLATTLIVAVATPEVVAAVQVGDGATVAGDCDGELFALTTPRHGEYVNETTFLISADALESAQIKVWRGAATHLALFSDGLQHLALNLTTGVPHPPFFAPLFRFVAAATDDAAAHKQLAAFLRSPRVTERTRDDVTLVLATCVITKNLSE